jgi:hypothetical protein
MVDCVVCQYWSERLDETRTRRTNTLQEEARLIATLRRHQRGSCACRFPNLLRDLVRQELELPDMAPVFCGRGPTPMLADSMSGNSEHCQSTSNCVFGPLLSVQ